MLSKSSDSPINGGIDRLIFPLAVSVVLACCIPLFLYPEASAEVLQQSYLWITETIGIFYQWAAIGAILFVAWLAFGKYGQIKLGEEGSEPEYSTFSFTGMLFCAGIGAGLLYWAGIEWVYYYEKPPFGIEPKSSLAMEWAAAYGLFHWGISAWCIYALPTIAIAYPYYVLKVPRLRVSTALHGLLGKSNENSLLARLVDLSFMVALIGGAATSLALSTPMISATIVEIQGLGSTTIANDIFVVVLCVSLFGISVYLGLDKGIRRLSEVNIILALLLLAYILLAGPSLFILRMGTDSLGLMVNNLIRMISFTDPVERTGFVEDWAIFYWAWWIAFSPFVGLFVTRISRGRTIRQVILTMTVFGSLGSWLFYIVMGNYALWLEINQMLPVTEIVSRDGAPLAIVQVLGTLPFKSVVLSVFAVVSIIFVATTYDSASYTLASVATRELRPGENPARWHRLFWAAAIGLLPVLLLFVGGTKVVQSATLISSLPFLGIGVLMCVSLTRLLAQSEDS